jgi:hypothetical protein
VISEGKSFIIDTLAPPAPQDVYGELVDNKAVLRWYYSGEAVDHFNIFRSTQPYVGLANYLASTKDVRYADLVNQSAGKYYYAINAVDLAGNDGPLSKEVSVVLTKEEKRELQLGDGSVIEIFLSNTSLQQVEGLLSEVGKLRFDMQSSSLGESSDEQNIRTELGVQAEVDSAIGTLNKIENELKLLRVSRLSDFEIDARLEVYKSQLKRIESTSKTVTILETIDYVQSPKIDAENLIGKLPLAEPNKQPYLEALVPYIANLEIGKRITTARIDHFNGFEEYKTIILENIGSQPADVILLEIPSTVPGASGITIIGETYRYLDKNLLVFSRKGLSGISYIVNGTLDKEKANAYSAFAIPDYNSFQPSETPLLGSISGNIAQEAGKYGLTLTEVIVIFSGIAAIGLLLLYYQFFVKGKVPLFLRDKSLDELQKNANDEIAELQRIAGKEPDTPWQDANKMGKRSQKVDDKWHDENNIARDSHNDITDMPKIEMTAQAEEKIEEKIREKTGSAALPHEGEKKRPEIKKAEPSKEEVKFETLMQELVFLIGSGDKKGATVAYGRLMKMYGSLPKEVKSRYYKECLGLYKKLDEKR